MSNDVPAGPSVREIAAAVRAGAPPPDLAAEAAGRASELNVFIHFEPSAVAANHDGPLAGVAFAVKDIVDSKDMPVSGGTPALHGRTAPRDAPVLASLRAAGGRLVGKTNLHELSFGITSNNEAFGAVRNPHDPTRIAGGSSGGSAVAVAAGIVPFAVAGDTGGSSRIPAALTGVVGFRPSAGRYSSDAVVPISPTRDTLGLIARTVDDVRYVDEVIAGPAAGTSVARRIGRPRDLFAEPHDPDVQDAYERALDRLASAGWDIVDVDLVDLFAVANDIGLAIALHEFRPALTAYLAQSHPGLSFDEVGEQVASPDVAGIWGIAADGTIDEAAYADAMRRRSEAQHDYDARLRAAGLDAVAFPTTAVTARTVGEDETIELAGAAASTFGTYTRHTNLAGVIGTPGISLPAGTDSHALPIGIELDGRAGRDGSLLGLAEEVEAVLRGVP